MRTAQQQLCVDARPQTPYAGLHPTEHTDTHQWGFTRAPRFGKILSRGVYRVQQHLLYSELSRNRINSHPNVAHGWRKRTPQCSKAPRTKHAHARRLLGCVLFKAHAQKVGFQFQNLMITVPRSCSNPGYFHVLLMS